VTRVAAYHKSEIKAGADKAFCLIRQGSEDGTIKIWDLRAPGCQRSYDCRTSVNSVVLHPSQAELISGDQDGSVKYAYYVSAVVYDARICMQHPATWCACCTGARPSSSRETRTAASSTHSMYPLVYSMHVSVCSTQRLGVHALHLTTIS
jgi:WD40 repeat protein